MWEINHNEDVENYKDLYIERLQILNMSDLNIISSKLYFKSFENYLDEGKLVKYK
jgi:hypothetical protein